MNLSALKSFAPAVRRQLIEAVGRKLDVVLTGDTADLRAARVQVEKLRQQAKMDRPGLVERVAYTWFNRLSALRLLDARGWHPFRARVLTPATAEETQPELLKLTRVGALPAELASLTDPIRLNQWLDGHLPSSDPQGEVYRHLVLAACRFYHRLMPFLFEALDDETELLLPDDLLTAHSIAHGFRTAISDEDCAEVEVLGWLYQFYIAERKDQVMARKSAVPSEDIPAVTQLFTPHWIVRYLVENSLGRLWLLNRPSSRLHEHMPYYIEGEPETDFLKITRPEDIRLLDPACGSGHMLTYAFDLLVKIYEEEGHAPSEIPGLILRHNLYGLEICPRAAQLAQFALVCKARENARAAFRNPVQPQVMCLQDVVFDNDELQNFSSTVHCPLSTVHLKQLHQFRENTSTFGSLIQPILTVDEITALKAKISDAAPSGDLLIQETHRKICRALDQAEMLSQRYHVIVENPPYCGARYMNSMLASFAKANFKAGTCDLFSVFVLRSRSLVYQRGFIGVVCPFVWMFLSDYEEFRKILISEGHFDSMIRLEYNAFEPACVPVSCWIYANVSAAVKETWFIDLSEFKGCEQQAPRALEAIANRKLTYNHFANCRDFLKVPSSPFAYEVSKKFRALFSTQGRLGDLVDFTGSQNVTGSNRNYVRKWWEVSRAITGRNARWVNYAKGGGSRKWWGLLTDLVDWSDAAREFYRSNKTSNPLDRSFWYRPGVTYSELTSNQPTFRLLPQDCVYDKAGPSYHPATLEMSHYLLALCNSQFASKVFDIVNPTLHVQVRDVRNVPLATIDEVLQGLISSIASRCVEVARADWDNFETSWDFRDLPLLRPGLQGVTLEESWNNWAAYCRANIARMQELETENNRLWIDAYGLQDELTPEVPENEITLARPDQRKDIAAFLSYAVGCMMGRYSLDAPGLILADAGDTLTHYLAKLGNPIEQLSFVPDDDGILPILDGDWFEDDIVARTRQFLRATFGDATLEANLRFIEASLGKDLRKYFLTDFYKDHLQTYKKRPIYWLFQSPKKGFNALIYLHRYTRDTANRVLNRYLREYLHKLQARLDQLDHVLASDSTPARDKTQARKESDQLRKIRRDCEDYERDILLPLAQQRLELDLDDGVKVNYLKLGNALAPIPGLAASSEE